MTLNDQLDRLAAFEPSPYPVISLYLNTQPDGRGRDNFQAFVRKELKARSQTYPARSAEREMLDRDLERIARVSRGRASSRQPTASQSSPATRRNCSQPSSSKRRSTTTGCSSATSRISTRWHASRRSTRATPSCSPTRNRTRILVIADGGVAGDTAIEGVKTRRTTQGGWSQARYQRHVENYHLHHIKDVVAALEKIVTQEGIDRVIVSGDPVVIPLLREQLPKALAEKVVDELSIPSDAPEADVLGRDSRIDGRSRREDGSREG